MKKNKFKNYLEFSALGLEMGLSLFIGFFLGQFLDEKIEIKPWGTVGGSFLGIITGFRLAYQRIKKIQLWLKNDK